MEVEERWLESRCTSGMARCSGQFALAQRAQQAGRMCWGREVYLMEERQQDNGGPPWDGSLLKAAWLGSEGSGSRATLGSYQQSFQP